MIMRIGSFVVRHRKSVLATYIITILAAGAIGSMAFGRLDAGGYSDTNSESAKAAAYITDTFKVQDPVAILIVDAGSRSVDDPTVIAEANALEKEVAAAKNIKRTISYWSTGGSPNLRSVDGKAAFLFIYADIENFDYEGYGAVGKTISENFDGKYESLEVYASGGGVVTHAINSKIKKDLTIAEAIAIPLTFVLLAFVFGALVASAMPLVVGVGAILGSFLIIYLLTFGTDISVFALNLITGLGLGLGIDYALLIVNRFREELNNGKSVEESVITTVATAGKTVFYSGLTVMVTLSALLLFPLNFLKSFGYAGVTVVLFAIFGALIPLPALLAIIGKKVNKGVVRKGGLIAKEDGRWARTARGVMAKPVPVVVGSLLILGILAAPVVNIAFAQVDSRVLPASDRAAISSQVAIDRFASFEGTPIEVIVPNGAGRENEINSFLMSALQVDGIVRHGELEYAGSDVRIQLIPSSTSRSLDAERIIQELRSLDAPSEMLIGGAAADFTDSQAAIARTLPWALGWIGVAVFILIFIFTGSIILPIKAVLLNGISLLATLGAVTWIFINGHLKWLVGDFTVTGSLDSGTVILVAVVVFGLSMDYELFLLSRIREEHLNGKSNVDSVAIGLQKSARIITAAALLLAVVFGAFMTSGITSIKMLGFGVAFAILLDATIVRALLVPALMRLFGEKNWWAPKPLRRFTLTH